MSSKEECLIYKVSRYTCSEEFKIAIDSYLEVYGFKMIK